MRKGIIIIAIFILLPLSYLATVAIVWGLQGIVSSTNVWIGAALFWMVLFLSNIVSKK